MLESAPEALPRPRGRLIVAAAKVPVRQVLDRYGIVPRKRFGQNFLHDPAVAARIVAAAAVRPGERILEIGPGLGALTIPLLDAGARVTAVEVDPRIAGFLRDELGGRAGFTLRQGDVLDEDFARLSREHDALVANLPYAITGPLLARLLDAPPFLGRVVVMVQKEVAARLTAAAGGREIGAPSVLLRLLYRVERLFDVGRGAFLPRPDVASSVLRLIPAAATGVEPDLREAVNRAYRNRRKMLRKTLAGFVASEEAIGRALGMLGHAEAARPEDLEPDTWPELLRRAAETER
jgi:16S rRNA (adenine1518-N6/adenine1519-N6)-dimethyltransferase